MLSGGERNRASTSPDAAEDSANLCCSSTNRPTISTAETLRALEEALEDYAGCAVVISHDRWFLDRRHPRLAFEGGNHVSGSRATSGLPEADKVRRLGIKQSSRIASKSTSR